MRTIIVGGIIGIVAIGVGLLALKPSNHPLPPKVTDVVASSAPDIQADIPARLAAMTLKEKVQQVFMWSLPNADMSSDEARLLTELRPGGVMLGGQLTHVDALRLSTKVHQLEMPLLPLISIDQEGGTVKRLTTDDLPSLASLSAQPELICIRTRASARWLKELGIDINFGVMGDIAWTPEAYIANRAYGSTAEVVSQVAEQVIRCSEDVLTTVKHFPGHGRTLEDSHSTLPVIDLSYDAWKMSDAVPFRRAITAGVPIVMTGHLIYPSVATEPASLAPQWHSELRAMGFKGVIITDDLSMMVRPGVPVSLLAQQAFTAGADMLLVVNPFEEYHQAIVSTLEEYIRVNGKEQELDSRVMRILELKAKAGLL